MRRSIHADLPRIPKARGKKNRPGDAAWKQQKLAAYRPLLTFKCALPLVVVISLVCLAGGVLLYESALAAQEGVIDYTDCWNANGSLPIIMNPNSIPPTGPPVFSMKIPRRFDEDAENDTCEHRKFEPKTCVFNLNISQPFTGNVTFYYGLTSYFQNMRQYFRSRNDVQLLGVQLTDVENCHPYDKSNRTGQELFIVPCGAVADSLFNDTFKLTYHQKDGSDIVVPWTSKGILSDDIRKRKFVNPVQLDNENLCDAFKDNITTTYPLHWTKPVCKLGDDDTGYGLENFDLIQWMTASALPDFRKVYRRLDYQPNDINFKDGLPAGNYTLTIGFNYPVCEYGSKKKFIIAVEGWFGPKNYFISYVYLATGAFFVSLAILMAIVEFCPYSPLHKFIEFCSEKLKSD